MQARLLPEREGDPSLSRHQAEVVASEGRHGVQALLLPGGGGAEWGRLDGGERRVLQAVVCRRLFATAGGTGCPFML